MRSVRVAVDEDYDALSAPDVVEGEYFVNAVAVRADLHRTGLGSMLLRHVLGLLAPGTYVWWKVDPANHASQKLSSSLGAEESQPPEVVPHFMYDLVT